jgi:hypothetical protein
VAASRVFRQVFPAEPPPARHLAGTPMPTASDSAGVPARPCGSLGLPPGGADRSGYNRHVSTHGW